MVLRVSSIYLLNREAALYRVTNTITHMVNTLLNTISIIKQR